MSEDRLRTLIADAVAVRAEKIRIIPRGDLADVCFIRTPDDQVVREWEWPEARRFIDMVKGKADMPVGRDKSHAGHVVINEDRYFGTVLVLTDPAPGGRERLELRLRFDYV